MSLKVEAFSVGRIALNGVVEQAGGRCVVLLVEVAVDEDVGVLRVACSISLISLKGHLLHLGRVGKLQRRGYPTVIQVFFHIS